MDETSSCLYIIDCTPTPVDAYFGAPGALHAPDECILGLEPPKEDTDSISSRCFNCGSKEHMLAACPAPINHQLVSLSRQLHDFFKGAPSERFTRLHEFESSRQQKLHWIETFVPGTVHGQLLREALGITDSSDAPWLRNMALWGYPPGWAQEHDPRVTLRTRVWDAGAPAEHEDTELSIIVDDDEVETVIIGRSAFWSDVEEEETVIHTSEPRATRRWAEYPPSHFQYHLLPVYNGFTLPPVGDVGEKPYPAPPTTAPPPLPPSPPPPPLPSTPPPLPPSFGMYHLPTPDIIRRIQSIRTPASSHVHNAEEPVDDGEQDMIISDEDDD